MYPPPTTTTRSVAASSARMRSTSARERTVWTPRSSCPPHASRRGAPPVAHTSLPYAIAAPSSSRTRCAAASTATTRRPRTRSMLLSAQNAGGRSSIFSKVFSPARYSFDSAGRSYGASGSSPTTPIVPESSCCRSVAATCAPPCPAPTTRTSHRSFIAPQTITTASRGSPACPRRARRCTACARRASRPCAAGGAPRASRARARGR